LRVSKAVGSHLVIIDRNPSLLCSISNIYISLKLLWEKYFMGVVRKSNDFLVAISV